MISLDVFVFCGFFTSSRLAAALAAGAAARHIIYIYSCGLLFRQQTHTYNSDQRGVVVLSVPRRIIIYIMAAEGEGDSHIIIIRFTYTGEEVIPDDATHIFVDVRVRTLAFFQHPNVVEVICSERVEKIESMAFYDCPNLKRVIMPGVKIVENNAFGDCFALTDVECGKLEIIGYAFARCYSLRSINLPSARVVGDWTFGDCNDLTDVRFSNKLERIEGGAFLRCTSLERITIPLKDGIMTGDSVFMGCRNLMHVDLVDEGAELYETIAALHLKDWRNDINDEIDSIN